MIINLKEPSNFYNTLEDLGFKDYIEYMDGVGKNQHFLPDGIYSSESKPIYSETDSSKEFEFDTEKDYICVPQDTDTVFLWKGEKPNQLSEDNRISSYSVKGGKFVSICTIY